MKPGARTFYHATLWPAVCSVQGWRKQDQDKRRDVCLECMESVRGPMVTTSHVHFKDAETTALFCYLRHLEEPHSITRLRDWEKCMADYKAFHVAKQADYWEERAYGRRGSPQLRNKRFDGRTSAVGTTFEDPLTKRQADQRHWKMRERARARETADTGDPF